MVRSVTLHDNQADSDIVAELSLTGERELEIWLKFDNDDTGGLAIKLNPDELFKAIEYLRK